jgi:translation initiation factor 2B subunit (eIF-2B alpha/beta/delta family)
LIVIDLTVNKTGSFSVAAAAKTANCKVLVVSRADKVQSLNMGEVFDAESNSGSELCANWFASAANTQQADAMKKFVTKAMEKQILKISNSYFEKVPVSGKILVLRKRVTGGDGK